MKRRSFLIGVAASPALLLVPAFTAPEVRFLPGDLVNFKAGVVPREEQTMLPVGATQVVADNGGSTVTLRDHGCRGTCVEYPRYGLELFEGLPGNRVRNPSTRHRLVRGDNWHGDAYPEDPPTRGRYA